MFKTLHEKKNYGMGHDIVCWVGLEMKAITSTWLVVILLTIALFGQWRIQEF